MGKFTASGFSVGQIVSTTVGQRGLLVAVRTDVEVFVLTAVLDVPEEDETSLVRVGRGDVGRVPGDDLRCAGRPHVARLGRGNGRAEHNARRSADRGRGGDKGGDDRSELVGKHGETGIANRENCGRCLWLNTEDLTAGIVSLYTFQRAEGKSVRMFGRHPMAKSLLREGFAP